MLDHGRLRHAVEEQAAASFPMAPVCRRRRAWRTTSPMVTRNRRLRGIAIMQRDLVLVSWVAVFLFFFCIAMKIMIPIISTYSSPSPSPPWPAATNSLNAKKLASPSLSIHCLSRVSPQCPDRGFFSFFLKGDRAICNACQAKNS